MQRGSSQSSTCSIPAHLEVHPPHRNIVASPEPSESSGSPRSTTPKASSLSLPLPLLPSPIADQLSKAGGAATDTDMSPAPAVTSLDDMDDSVVYASTDSSSRDNDHDSDGENDCNGTNNMHYNGTGTHNSKLDHPDRHLTIELQSSHTSSTVPHTNVNTEEGRHHPARPPYDPKAGFSIGFAEDRNRRHRRTMEDAHAFISNFQDVQGQGYFAIFDGHAGKGAAEWCGQHFHETLQDVLQNTSQKPIPEVLNETFVSTDKQLADRPGMYSGCTAAVALLKVEDVDANDSSSLDTSMDDIASTTSRRVNGQPTGQRRVLYTANAGDARIVLCRNGVAERLSYDHKGSDVPEQHRISEAGGFVLNNRVNGVLAVTRSLGDVAMKEWVIGNPYTVETPICETDTFFIVACDGLWDVCTDQTAVDLVSNIEDPQKAAEQLLVYALEHWSTDNLSVMVVRLDPNWEYEASIGSSSTGSSNESAKAIVTTSGFIDRD